MAFSSSSSSSLLLHFKLSLPHTQNPFRRFSSNSCYVPPRILPKCCSQSFKSRTLFKCYSQRQSSEQKTEEILEGEVVGIREEVYDFERLFSNLNQATLKREAGIFNLLLSWFIFHCFIMLDFNGLVNAIFLS